MVLAADFFACGFKHTAKSSKVIFDFVISRNTKRLKLKGVSFGHGRYEKRRRSISGGGK